jgi:hypothetical protein
MDRMFLRSQNRLDDLGQTNSCSCVFFLPQLELPHTDAVFQSQLDNALEKKTRIERAKSSNVLLLLGKFVVWRVKF